MSRTLSRHVGPLARRVSAAGLLALTVASVAAGAAAAPTASARAMKSPAGHARPHVYHPSGRGQAKAARIVNFRKRARAWQARHRQHAAPPRTASQITPFAAFTTAFDGISQGNCAGCFPDPSVATSANGGQIMETTDDFVQVFDKVGTTLCDGGMTADAFLGLPAGSVARVRVQYDDVSNQFIVTAYQVAGAPPALYIAATTSHDACGSWNVFKLVLSGDPLTPTSDIFNMSAGQDAQALLLSVAADVTPSQAVVVVLAVPKAAVYAGSPLSEALFSVGDNTVIPVTMGGSPMINTPDSYFFGDGNDGYQLYTMTGSGSAQPSLESVLLGHPDVSFLVSTPVFDGSRIWFADFFCGEIGNSCVNVHYGYVAVADDSMTFGQITSPPGTFDGGPSVTVDPDSDGTVSVFLDWLNNAANSPHAQTDLVKSFIYPGGPLPDNAPLDQVVASSGSATDLGGDFSAAAADPGSANGACAVTAQVYFRPDGTWTTRVRRKCGPLPPVEMPSVIGDSRAAGISAVQAAGFVAAVTDVTTPGVSCNADTAGTIFDQDPLPSLVSAGVTAHLAYCDITTTVVPNVTGDTPDQAAAALQAAGLTEGSVIGTSNCSPASNGLILATAPAIGTRQVTGTQVSLQECTNNMATVPDVTGDTPDQAAAAIQAAGLTVGSTSLTTSCDVPVGTIVRTSPPAGDIEPAGTTVNLIKSKGRSATCD